MSLSPINCNLQLWDKHHLTLSWSRSADPAVHTQSACCPRLRGYGETP